MVSQLPLPPKRSTACQFSVHVYWMDEDTAWYGCRPRPRPHCVRRWPSSPAKWVEQPHLFSAHVYCGHGRPSHQFSAHVCCGQTAGCIKMPLDREVDVSPGDTVLDGDPAPNPPKKGVTASPQMLAHVLWSNCCMDQNATWYGARPRPRPPFLHGDATPLCKRGTAPPPISIPCLL